ncbi:MAG: hypothetical protein ABIY51_01645 [Ferruginibacter sp.]
MIRKLFICMHSFMAIGICVMAQSDTEFEKGFIMHLKLQQGMITNFHQATDGYVGGIFLNPQITAVPHILRLGADAGVIYAGKKIGGLAGPLVSLKLKTLKAGPFGSAGNINLFLSHLWGTGKQQLVGGGLGLDLLNKLLLNISAHRDYGLNAWWFQTGLGIKLTKTKKVNEPFNQ